ncbi:MAG TPA: hypothetical protein VF339_11060 [Gammaproteobacteria bacterium]
MARLLALDGWLRDFRFAARSMARRPGASATVVLTLALGIAATTVIFALVDTVLLRPLPYPDSAALVVAVLACVLPGMRAAATAPAVALRGQ